MEMRDKHIGEVHGELRIMGPSSKPNQGYLYYYWCKCSCGNIKRYRYDQARRAGSCGLCEDARASNLTSIIEREYHEN